MEKQKKHSELRRFGDCGGVLFEIPQRLSEGPNYSKLPLMYGKEPQLSVLNIYVTIS